MTGTDPKLHHAEKRRGDFGDPRNGTSTLARVSVFRDGRSGLQIPHWRPKERKAETDRVFLSRLTSFDWTRRPSHSEFWTSSSLCHACRYSTGPSSFLIVINLPEERRRLNEGGAEMPSATKSMLPPPQWPKESASERGRPRPEAIPQSLESVTAGGSQDKD